MEVGDDGADKSADQLQNVRTIGVYRQTEAYTAERLPGCLVPGESVDNLFPLLVDPRLLLRYRHGLEAPPGIWVNPTRVNHGPPDAGGPAAGGCEGHVCHAARLARILGHVRVQICVVHVEGRSGVEAA